MNREKEGLFLLPGGETVDEDVLDETLDFLEEVHDDLNQFGRDNKWQVLSKILVLCFIVR